MKQITVTELKERLNQGSKITLLDVREKPEWENGHIEGATWIPLREIPQRMSELEKTDAIVAYCHHGGRSQMAASQLLQAGFENVTNLTGGIDAWSVEVDSSIPRY